MHKDEINCLNTIFEGDAIQCLIGATIYIITIASYEVARRWWTDGGHCLLPITHEQPRYRRNQTQSIKQRSALLENWNKQQASLDYYSKQTSRVIPSSFWVGFFGRVNWCQAWAGKPRAGDRSMIMNGCQLYGNGNRTLYRVVMTCLTNCCDGPIRSIEITFLHHNRFQLKSRSIIKIIQFNCPQPFCLLIHCSTTNRLVGLGQEP